MPLVIETQPFYVGGTPASNNFSCPWCRRLCQLVDRDAPVAVPSQK